MKAIYLIVLFALAASATSDENNRISGENGWYIPQKDGSWLWMDKEEALKKLADAKVTVNAPIAPSKLIDFYLNTAANPKEAQRITSTRTSIDESHFNASNPTRIMIHSWDQFYLSDMNTDIRDAWLRRGKYNMITVDWAQARFDDYIASVGAVPIVGEVVASFIDRLATTHGMSLDTMVVIGHGLGAHVAGYAGKNVKSGKINTIVGLDPALPLFDYDKPHERLSSTDAYYVQSINTNGGKMGIPEPIGTGTFYVNGGQSQPGCAWWVPTETCSHKRSYAYYAEAVEKDNFVAIECDDYEKAIAKSCGDKYSSVRMGALNKSSMVAGYFFVPVNSAKPFGMGH